MSQASYSIKPLIPQPNRTKPYEVSVIFRGDLTDLSLKHGWIQPGQKGHCSERHNVFATDPRDAITKTLASFPDWLADFVLNVEVHEA